METGAHLPLLAALAGLALAAGLAGFPPGSQAHDRPVYTIKVTANDLGSQTLCLSQEECWFTTNRTGDTRNPNVTLPRGAEVHVTFVVDGGHDHNWSVFDPVGFRMPTHYSDSETPKEFTFTVPWDADEAAAYECELHPSSMVGNATFEGPGNTAPDLSVTKPEENDQVQDDVVLKGDVLDDEDGADELTVEVKAPPSGSWEEATVGSDSGWSFTWDSTAVDDGVHTLEVRATDHHGLQVEANRTVQVVNGQNAAPSVSVDSPAAGAEVRGEVAITGSAEDPEGDLSAVEVKLPPGETWEAVDGLQDWSVTWNTSGLEPGDYTVEVRASDGDAQETVSHPLTVVNESANRAPRLSISQPEPGEEVRGESQVVGTAHDPDGDAVQVEVRDPASSTWSGAVGPGPDDEWHHGWNASGLEAGTYTVEVRASDGGATVWRNVTVQVPEEENRSPTISFVSPAPGDEVRPPVTAVVEADDVDPDDAVESVRVRFGDAGTFREADPRAGDRWTVQLPGENVTEGSARIKAVASDGEETSQAIVEVEVAAPPDSPAPALEVTNPPPDRAEGLVVVTGRVEDAQVQSPPLVVELRVDGDLEDLVETTGSGSFELSWQARRAGDGVHDLAVVARDGVASSEVTFAVRVGPPEAETAGIADDLATPGPGLPALVLAGAGAAAVRRGLRRRR